MFFLVEEKWSDARERERDEFSSEYCSAEEQLSRTLAVPGGTVYRVPSLSSAAWKLSGSGLCSTVHYIKRIFVPWQLGAGGSSQLAWYVQNRPLHRKIHRRTGSSLSIEELRDRREGKGRLWFLGYLMQLEGEGGVIIRQSFKKRHMEIWWELNLWPSDFWLCTLPLDHQYMWEKKNDDIYLVDCHSA